MGVVRAVSYTHLDVYKRQVLCHTVRRGCLEDTGKTNSTFINKDHTDLRTLYKTAQFYNFISTDINRLGRNFHVIILMTFIPSHITLVLLFLIINK